METPYGKNPRLQLVTDCPECNGELVVGIVDEEGFIRDVTCPTCQGTGSVTHEVELGDVAEFMLEALGVWKEYMEFLASREARHG